MEESRDGACAYKRTCVIRQTYGVPFPCPTRFLLVQHQNNKDSKVIQHQGTRARWRIADLPDLCWSASSSWRLKFSLYFGDGRSCDFACFGEQRDVWTGSVGSILRLPIFDCERNLFSRRPCLSVPIHPVVLVCRQGTICCQGCTDEIVVRTRHDRPLPINASRINLQPYF